MCPTCVLRLTRGLTRLPRLYHECGLLLGGSDRPRESTSGGGSLPGLPFNTAAAEARATILGVLRSWAGLVVRERAVAAPRDTVGDIAEFLIRQARWLAAHEAAGALSEEVEREVRRAQHVTDPSPGRRVRVGTCAVARCEGVLTATVRADRPDTPVEVGCDAVSSHRWSAQEWIALHRVASPGGARRDGQAVTEPVVRWLSARDISRLWRIASGSVYRHASEQRWRRRTVNGRTFYHGGDVLRSLGVGSASRP
ncbi:hypothetical protein [Streptomyces sp. NBRC 109706]|uniref:hypothetical protein n=1 Tax=Streptomyces sp. NBRC 109706 TaxID=1550035 RepID=UPI00131C7DD7|nr:hypothetical protein [Streptomyces sp. NBRC 109706]